MPKKYRIGYTQEVNDIVTYVNTCPTKVVLKDLIQHCVDYEMYNELYMNYPIIHDLIIEHNETLNK